ncbi:MAG: OST-HTH/LOTUS domain-containing protein, partial [Rhodoferax sp.]
QQLGWDLQLHCFVRRSGHLGLAWHSCSLVTWYAPHTKFLTGSSAATATSPAWPPASAKRNPTEPFVAACDKFVYTEILRTPAEEAKAAPEPVAELPKPKPMLLNAPNATAREDGWTTLSALGSQLNRSNPSFDPRNYGVAKLGELIRQQAAYLDVKEVKSGEGDAAQVHLHVRRKVGAQKG